MLVEKARRCRRPRSVSRCGFIAPRWCGRRGRCPHCGEESSWRTRRRRRHHLRARRRLRGRAPDAAARGLPRLRRHRADAHQDAAERPRVRRGGALRRAPRSQRRANGFNAARLPAVHALATFETYKTSNTEQASRPAGGQGVRLPLPPAARLRAQRPGGHGQDAPAVRHAQAPRDRDGRAGVVRRDQPALLADPPRLPGRQVGRRDHRPALAGRRAGHRRAGQGPRQPVRAGDAR